MPDYEGDFARFLAQSGALFFASGLRLKDGRPTPYFINLGRVNTGRLGLELAGFFARMLIAEGLVAHGSVLIGPSYKGSAIAALAAASLWTEHGLEVGFDYDRKEAKTHGEASGSGKVFVTGALAAGSEGVILDDVATSMATKIELVDKIRAAAPGFKIRAVVIGVDREQTQPVYDASGRLLEGVRGEDAIKAFTEKTGIPVRAVAGVRAVVQYLYENKVPVLVDGQSRALGQEEKERFDEYLAVYGR